jgi:hypothetical protein
MQANLPFQWQIAVVLIWLGLFLYEMISWRLPLSITLLHERIGDWWLEDAEAMLHEHAYNVPWSGVIWWSWTFIFWREPRHVDAGLFFSQTVWRRMISGDCACGCYRARHPASCCASSGISPLLAHRLAQRAQYSSQQLASNVAA